MQRRIGFLARRTVKFPPGPPAVTRQAQALLRRFGSVRVLWQPAALLAAWLEEDDGVGG